MPPCAITGAPDAPPTIVIATTTFALTLTITSLCHHCCHHLSLPSSPVVTIVTSCWPSFPVTTTRPPSHTIKFGGRGKGVVGNEQRVWPKVVEVACGGVQTEQGTPLQDARCESFDLEEFQWSLHIAAHLGLAGE